MTDLLLRCCHHIASFNARDITPANWASRIGHFQFRRSTSGFPVSRPQAEHDATQAARALHRFVLEMIAARPDAQALRRECCRFLAPWSDDDTPASFEGWCGSHGMARYRIARGDWDRFGRTTEGPGDGPDFSDANAVFLARQEALRLIRFVAEEIKQTEARA